MVIFDGSSAASASLSYVSPSLLVKDDCWADDQPPSKHQPVAGAGWLTIAKSKSCIRIIFYCRRILWLQPVSNISFDLHIVGLIHLNWSLRGGLTYTHLAFGYGPVLVLVKVGQILFDTNYSLCSQLQIPSSILHLELLPYILKMTDRHETSRHKESGERRHKKRRSRQPASGNATSSEGTRSGHSSRPALSMDALAALNEVNTRSVDVGASTRRDRDEQDDLERRQRHQERRERRRRESRAKVDRDEYREVEPDSPKPRRHRESRERASRDEYREAETDSPRPRRHRESRERVAQDEYREVEAASPNPRRHRKSRSYPAPPAYEEDVDAGSDYHDERRQRRKGHSSKAYEATPEIFRDMVAGREDHERRHKERKRKNAATVTPAVVEEGRFMGFWHNMRGGGTNASTSYDSFEKEEAYDESPRKKGFWTRKKICKCFLTSHHAAQGLFVD